MVQFPYEEAIKSYNKAISLQPDNADAWNNRCDALRNLNRGDVLLNLKRYEEAIKAYNKAIQLHPDFQVAINNRKIAQQNLKKSKSWKLW